MPKIGGGRSRAVEAVHGKKGTVHVEVIARMPLFERPSGVILSPPRFAGQMLVPRWEDGKGRDAGRKVPKWTIVPDVFAAIRQAQHTLLQYGADIGMGEKADMLEAMRLARELNIAVLTAPAGTDAVAMRERLRAAISDSARLLGNPRTPSKKRALALLAAIGKGEDATGRPNPSALMARSLAVHERLRERLEKDILVIDPMIEARQKVFVEMVQLASGWLTALDDYLIELLKTDGMKPLFKPGGRAANAAHMAFFANEIGTIDFLPFRQGCIETERDLRRCAHLLAFGPLTGGPQGKLAEIRHLAINCRSAMALKAVQIDLERVIYRITQGLYRTDGRYSFNAERRRLNTLYVRLEGLDERWMRKRVVRAAQAPLLCAIAVMTSARVTDLAEIRDLLKDASAVL